MMKKLAIGNDHVAIDMKNELKAYLEGKGYEIVNVGTDVAAKSFDYAISGYRVARMVADGEVDGGILICGTGVGIQHHRFRRPRHRRGDGQDDLRRVAER